MTGTEKSVSDFSISMLFMVSESVPNIFDSTSFLDLQNLSRESFLISSVKL